MSYPQPPGHPPPFGYRQPPPPPPCMSGLAIGALVILGVIASVCVACIALGAWGNRTGATQPDPQTASARPLPRTAPSIQPSGSRTAAGGAVMVPLGGAAAQRDAGVPADDARFAAMTPAEHLEAGRGALAGGDLDGAERHLRAVPRRAREARAAAAAQREIAARRRQAAAAAALAIVCGATPPPLSAWDGELVGSEPYIRRTANDPDSIDVDNCTPPVLTREACWVTSCTVRGRNAFGAMVAQQTRFSVGRNNAILGAQRE